MAAAAVAPPDEKFLKLKEENERRRKKKDEEEKRRKQDEELKTKETLERRRIERLEQDERMRKPWQQPPAPKKPILRKGAKSKPSQPPTPSAADPMRKSQQEEKRKELRQGLQDFIRQQRQAAVPPKTPTGGGGGGDGAPVVPLTWEELRLAAEAGFDELVRQQEADAEQRADDPVAARAARHRSPYKSPFRGAPAPPQETVQVSLVPTQQHQPVAAAAPAPGSPAAAAAAASHMAALRTSYKFSDAPGWAGQHPATQQPLQQQQQQQQRPGVDAANGGGPMAAPAAAVLYPPGDAPEAVAGASDVGAGSSVASSGGLRRGVTAAARYRVAPLDAETLDSAAEDPWGRAGAAAGGAVDAGVGGTGGEVGVGVGVGVGLGDSGPPVSPGGSRSPRGSMGQRPPLPGPYDSPSQQVWPPPSPRHSQQQQQQQQTVGTPRRPSAVAVPGPPADPLEASLLAGGTLAALQQADGFRLTSPRPAGTAPQQTWDPPAAPTHSQEQLSLQPSQSAEYARAQQQQQQQQQPPSAQKTARRGWGAPPGQAPAPAPQQQQQGDPGAPYDDEPPMPAWAQAGAGSQGGIAAPEHSGAWAGGGAGGGVGQSGAEFGGDSGPDTGASIGLAGAGALATVRHSIGVGDSGGPAMWQRESVALPREPQPQVQHTPAELGAPPPQPRHEGSDPRLQAGGPAELRHPELLAPAVSPVPGPGSGTRLSYNDVPLQGSPALTASVASSMTSTPAPGSLASPLTLPLATGSPHQHEAPEAPAVDRSSVVAAELSRAVQSRVDASAEATRASTAAHMQAPEEGAMEDGSEKEQEHWIPPMLSALPPPVDISTDGLLPVPAAGRQEALQMSLTEATKAAGSTPPPVPASTSAAPAFATSQPDKAALPPVITSRPLSGSARLPPLPSGFHSGASVSGALPPLVASDRSVTGTPPKSQLVPGGTASATSICTPATPPQQQSPAPHQPHPPPMRAPSPPGSPPRNGTPQRFHRQLSSSGGSRPQSADLAERSAASVTAAPAATASSTALPAQPQPQQVLAPQPPAQAPPSHPSRPRSADLLAAAVPAAVPASEAAPSSGGAAVVAAAPASPPPSLDTTSPSVEAPAVAATPVPASPRVPGVVVTTPASGLSRAPQPLQPPPPAAPEAQAVGAGRTDGAAASASRDSALPGGEDSAVVIVDDDDDDVQADIEVDLDSEQASPVPVRTGLGAPMQPATAAAAAAAAAARPSGAPVAGPASSKAAAAPGPDEAEAARLLLLLQQQHLLHLTDASVLPARPPGTAGSGMGSIMSGSHISAAPPSESGGSSSAGGGGAAAGGRPGSAATAGMMGSGYQASLLGMLDDSVSSFDFRMPRSAGGNSGGAGSGSRPSSAAWAPPASPAAPVYATIAAAAAAAAAAAGAPPVATPGKGDSVTGKAGASSNGAPPAASKAGAAVPLTRSAAAPTAVRAGASSSANTFQVLQPPKAAAAAKGVAGELMYGGLGADDGVGVGDQGFEEEPVDWEEPAPRQPPAPAAASPPPTAAAAAAPLQLPTTLAATGAPAATAPATAAPATAAPAAGEPDMDDLMREIQALSALRKALKAEFEGMGHGEAVAGLQTLSANFTAAAGSNGNGASASTSSSPAHTAGSGQGTGASSTGIGAVGVAGAAAAAAAPTPAPLLQWGFPGGTQPQQQQLLGAAPAYTVPPPMPMPAPQQQQQQQQQAVEPHLQMPAWAALVMPPQPVAEPPAAQAHPQQLPPQPQPQQQAAQQSALQGPYGAAWPQPGSAQLPTQQAAPPLAVTLPSAAATLAPGGLPMAPFPVDAMAAAVAAAAGPNGVAAPGWGPQDGAEDPHGRSFAFAAPQAAAGGNGFYQQHGALPEPLPLAPPVMPAPQPPPAPAPAPPPPQPALQWTIPAAPGSSNPGAPPQPQLSPQRPARVSGGGAASGGGATPTKSTPSAPSAGTKCTPVNSTGGGGYAALESPGSVSDVRHATRSGTGTLPTPNPAMAAAERPLINDGSYARAAIEARERAERERAAREALAAETAAAKAAALQRSKSEHRAGGGGAAGGGSSTSPTAGAGSGATKAPSAIGSYVRKPSPSPARPLPLARSTSTGRDGGARGAAAAEPSSSGTTPNGTRAASRIPTPPRPRGAGAATSGVAGGKQQAVEDSDDSDLDFLERASDASDTEADSPSPARPGARREAFASPSSATAAAAAAANAAAYRERLAEARPKPLRIPTSGAATPMGGASTASTVASHAVPTGGGRAAGAGSRAGGAPMAAAPQRSGHSGTSGKPVTPFTAAIRELMGLPGSAPLEQSRAAAGAAVGRGGQLLDARGQWPSRLTEEEDRLLASLKRLDGEVLKRGLAAAGLVNDPSVGGGKGGKAAGSKGAGKGTAAGAAAAGGGGGGGPNKLTNSLQQDQLRESLERLDSQLGALRRKMEDRACMLGMPSSAAPTPSAGAVATTPGKPAASTRGRDTTPTKTPEERRGPPATLAKSRTPTPNKAKAIRDQRQQQLTSHQGPTPPSARNAGGTASAPPKPASAPVMGTMGGMPAAPDAMHYQQGPPAATAMPPPASASAAQSAGYSGIPQGPGGMSGAQPHGMPPRAPPARAPASAPTGPAATNAAAQQQHHQQQQGPQGPPGAGMMMLPNGMMVPYPSPAYGAMPGGGAHMMNPYGMPTSPGGGGGGAPHGMPMPQQAPQQQQQPQVAYVPTMLPNGQMAYVPQYVMPGGGGAYMPPNMGFPQMMMQPPGMQQPQPMMAWGASPPPSAQAVPASPGGPSLYSFDRASNQGTPPQAQQYPQGGGGPGSYDPAYQHQQYHQQHQHAPPFVSHSPPPSGPMPHYHSTVMRSRSIGSRDGEAMTAAAAAAGFVQQPQQQRVPHSAPQANSVDGMQGGAVELAAPQSSREPSVQFQSFGPNGGSRGLGPGAAWGGGGAGGGAGPAEGGVIKAGNLGLLFS
ncbi:hypothetical protein HXX76_006003 [Chlamydomonas incerta]|uniref:Uncharacterized protein n=1 Tax=Chlamydomonas incerta TaxID=51695 RepID=A0A835T203_CHLIN|nr:hypothetical protein HXX76_006003 [Chlamydomonas incerta]|eukprot:KAG2437348.1 hypothetical protein HXX76_006003 [Chlamydomonas incerta]